MTDQTPSDGGQTEVTVTTAEAAALAGVTARTIRRWIDRGYLPAVSTADGWRVSPADLPSARTAANLARGGGQPRLVAGHIADVHTPSAGRPHGQGSDTPDGLVPATLTAYRQLEAIREQWLAPLVAQISDQAEEIGQLKAERDTLQARLNEFQTLNEESPMPADSNRPMQLRSAWWKFWQT